MKNRNFGAAGAALLSAALVIASSIGAVQADTEVLFDDATANARCLTGYPGVTGPDALSSCQWDMQAIKAGPAHAADATGRGVKVGVIDGGVDFSHPDLAGAIDVARSCSFINSTTPTADPQEVANGDCSNKAAVQDLQGHGTHVSTTIAARANGIGIVGVAPEATIVALKACTIAGYCFADSVAAALRYAGDQQLDVVNLSLFADPSDSNSPGTPSVSRTTEAERPRRPGACPDASDESAPRRRRRAERPSTYR